MSYRLEANETLPQGVRRMACEEIDLALAYLADASTKPATSLRSAQALREVAGSPSGASPPATSPSPTTDRDQAVHEVRKCCKKIRALLRLVMQPKVADDIGKDVYRRENIFYRDAGRRLSDLRESAVMVETLDKVAGHFADELDEGALNGVRTGLIQAHQSFSQRLYHEEKVLEATTASLASARLRTLAWSVACTHFTAVATGVGRVYRRGRRRLADVQPRLPTSSSPTPEAFHEWRKEVKYLYYQLTILELLQPAGLQVHASKLQQLSEYLGHDHDLYALRRYLEGTPALFDTSRHFQLLLTLIERRRAELQAAARPLGEQLYAEEAEDFARRINTYWEEWSRKT